MSKATMSRGRRSLLVCGFGLALALFGAAGPARAETHGDEVALEHGEPSEHGGHGEHGPSLEPGRLALQLLNFGVLVGILVFFGGRAMNKSLRARHEQLKADLKSAADLRAAAEAKLGTQEKRLASLEAEIADLRLSLKGEAEAEKARLVAAAEERAARLKAETTFMIDQQVREADQRLRRESADAALKIAEEILRKAMNPADQQRLLETFVKDVEHGAGTGRVS